MQAKVEQKHAPVLREFCMGMGALTSASVHMCVGMGVGCSVGGHEVGLGVVHTHDYRHPMQGAEDALKMAFRQMWMESSFLALMHA